MYLLVQEMRVFFDVLDGSRDAEVSQDEFVKDFNEWTYFSVASMVVISSFGLASLHFLYLHKTEDFHVVCVC